MLPNLQIPHWDTTQSTDGIAHSPFTNALHPLISNDMDTHAVSEDLDIFSADHFRMFQFKVRNCPRGRSHDWTECPYAHPAEKARRRDPRKYHYSGIPCPEFRMGHCYKGESCEFAHGVFECWLHPSRYRTQFCKDGTSCRRRVCFFAHTREQLRVLSPALPNSPIRQNANASFVSSPTSVLDANSQLLLDSPPASPGYGAIPNKAVGVRELVSSMRSVQLDDVASPMGCVFGSPRGRSIRPGFLTSGCVEEPAMERVESGRDIRARMYAKLSRENSIGRSDVGFSAPIPDIGWVSELVK